jgi:hypothetical protein
MHKLIKREALIAVLCGLTALASPHFPTIEVARTSRSNDPAPAPPVTVTPVLPVWFEPNVGQVPGNTEWVARTAGANVYIKGTELVYALRPPGTRDDFNPQRFTRDIHMRLVGADADATAEGFEPMGSCSNYFLGRGPERWFTGRAASREDPVSERLPRY